MLSETFLDAANSRIYLLGIATMTRRQLLDMANEREARSHKAVEPQKSALKRAAKRFRIAARVKGPKLRLVK